MQPKENNNLQKILALNLPIAAPRFAADPTASTNPNTKIYDFLKSNL